MLRTVDICMVLKRREIMDRYVHQANGRRRRRFMAIVVSMHRDVMPSNGNGPINHAALARE